MQSLASLALLLTLSGFHVCSVQDALPERHSGTTGQLHDPVQQKLLWLGAWFAECVSTSVGPWQQPNSSATPSAEPCPGVTHSSFCAPAGLCCLQYTLVSV